MTSLLMISAVAAFTMPNNTYNLPYYVLQEHSNGTSWRVIYTANKMEVVGGNIWVGNGEVSLCLSDNDGTSWTYPTHSMTGITAGNTGYTIVSANYDVGTFVAPKATIQYPLDLASYTEYKEIWFELEDVTINEIEVKVTYIGADGYDYPQFINPSDIIFDNTLQYYVIVADKIPYGIGVNKIAIQKASDHSLLDEIWVTYTKAHLPECKIVGLTNNANYQYPPSISINKVKYPDVVSLYVNDERYASYYDVTKTYYLYSSWQANLKLGTNEIRLYNENTEEDIETYTINVVRGFIDENGTYFQHDPNDPDSGFGGFGGGGGGDTGVPSAWDQLTENPPEKPPEGSDLITWLAYIGNTIAWVFEIAITAIAEFGKGLGNALTSLLSIFTPVLAFLSMIFNALPEPLAVGLFALFTVGVVLAIYKIIRG